MKNNMTRWQVRILIYNLFITEISQSEFTNHDWNGSRKTTFRFDWPIRSIESKIDYAVSFQNLQKGSQEKRNESGRADPFRIKVARLPDNRFRSDFIFQYGGIILNFLVCICIIRAVWTTVFRKYEMQQSERKNDNFR